MQAIISALHFDWNSMAECLRIATRDLGLDGVEVSWHESFARPHCTRADLDDLAARPDRDGARLSAHIWDDVAGADPAAAEASLLEWLAECRRTGAADLVIHGGSYPHQREGIARTRRVFERVLPAFERAGVALNLENHYAYDYRACRELFSEPWEFLEVLAIDSPSLRLCFDTGHANMTRNSRELLDALAPWVRYVHLADNHGVDDDHVPYRCGTVAWDEVFAALHAIGGDPVLCVEYPVREDRDPFHACMRDIRGVWGA